MLSFTAMKKMPGRRKAPVKRGAGAPLLILFNKPFRVLCQFTGGEGRETLADYIPVPGVYAAGRLDYDSEGLVAFTGSGPLQHLLTDPANRMPKTYLVQVEGVPDEPALSRLRNGVFLKDGMTRPAVVETVSAPGWLWPRVPPIRFRKNVPDTWLRITITEGRNRQVRRMTASVGYPALRLIRISIGPLDISGLGPGQWTEVAVPSGLASKTERQKAERKK